MNSKATDKKDGILSIALNLTFACLISGIVLAVTYYLTADTAARKSEELKYSSMKTLVSDADSFSEVNGKDGWYVATKNGQTIAYIVPATSKGYGGTIEFLVAVDPQESVINFEVTSGNETPGLGDKATKEPFTSQFKGKSIDNLVVVKDPSDKNDILPITGATISSKAITQGVKNAVAEVDSMLGGK